MGGDPPPSADEYNRYTYHDGGWCGTNGFGSLYQRGKILALLRTGETFAAMQWLIYSNGKGLEQLLEAYGVDPDEFAVGSWLVGNLDPHELAMRGKRKRPS